MIFDYDKAGNRLLKIPIGIFSALSPALQTAIENSCNSINQIEEEKILDQAGQNAIVDATFDYDINRNIKAIKYPLNQPNDQEFYFDGMNKLRVCKKGNHEIRYKYNSEGQLIERKLIDNSASPPSEEITTINYLFSRPIVLKRTNDLFLVATWDSTGQLLRIRRDLQIGRGLFPHSLFPLYNAQGDIVRFVDSDKNEPVAISYNSWGVSSITGAANLFEFWGYRGGILDKETELILFGARWYSPKLGRWISEDLIDHSELLNYRENRNLYSYTLNNPICFADPSGLNSVPKYNPTPEAQLLESPFVQFTNLPAFRPERLKMLGFELKKGKFSRHQLWVHPSGHQVYYWANPEIKEGLALNEHRFGKLWYEVKSNHYMLRYYEGGTIERQYAGHSEYWKYDPPDKDWVMYDPDTGEILMYDDRAPE
jgi:RHS repeat-associated protein